MSRKMSGILGVILILGVGTLVYSQKRQADRQALRQSTAPLVQHGALTLADIGKHADRGSCWSAINGNVYDLTSWIPRHPGGEQAIVSICGIDGSSRFNAQHGGSPLQQQILAGFKIGTIKQ